MRSTTSRDGDWSQGAWRRVGTCLVAVSWTLSLLTSSACVTHRNGALPPRSEASLTARPLSPPRLVPPRLVPPSESGRERASYVARGQTAMVATAHPLASEAGLKMLRQGGNAVDAAVAASFVISVVRPQSTGIGGGGFMLASLADKQTVDVYDFRERAPAKAHRNMYLDAQGNPVDFWYDGQKIPNASVNGHLAVGVPGLIAGLLDVHAAHGKLALKTVMADAIKVAEDGFTVYAGLARAIEARKDILQAFPGSRSLFMPEGLPLKAGDTLIQKDLAWTLKQVRDRGKAGFYQGAVAERLIAEIERGKGLLTRDDLNNYATKTRAAVEGRYRGHRIVSMPPPSSGGVHIVQMLNMLETDNYGAMAHGSSQGVHVLAEVMRRAFADRAQYLGDTDFVRVPVKGLVHPAYAKMLRATIDPIKATPSNILKPGRAEAYESPSTTHLSVVDGDGNAVSTTQTINYTFGSCVVAQGTGIVLNDEMDDFSKKPGVPNAFGLVGSEANAIAAGKTMLSSMSPTLVFNPDGSLKLVVGSPGGPRIISATLQTVINSIDHKMELADAVHAARIHHQWLPDELVYEEGGLAPEVVEELKQRGHNMVIKGTIGDVQAISREPDGLVGVSDTRSEGIPMGY